MLASPFNNELLSTVNRARAPSPERLPRFPILTNGAHSKPAKMGVWSLMAGKLGKGPGVPPQEVAPAQPKPQREKLQKPQNKLSKPRTNSTGNLLNVPNSANTSRKNSATDLREGLPRRSSSVPSRPSPGELELQHSHTLSERRLESAISANSVPSQPTADAGRGRGRPTEREGKEKKGRLSQFFRSRSSQAVPAQTRAQLHEISKDEMPASPTQERLDAVAERMANPLHRYSQHTRPVYPLAQHGSHNVRDSLPARNINRTSSYAPYHTHGLNRLSLVAEQPTPLATPAMERELQLQHISETEDILTGRTNSNASRRQSMMSTTSSYTQNNFQPSRANSMRLDSMTRMDSTSRLNSMTSETSDAAFMPPPMRRRSLMTPGVATRVEDPSKYPLPRQKLQKEPPVARRMSVQPSTSVSDSSFFTKIRRSQTLPSDAESPDYYNSSEMPKETPEEILHRLQPLAKPTFRRSLELQRVNTPNDMGHIGGFKLGSLRITNGTVSPSATPKHVEKAREVDYFHLQRAALGATVQTVSDPNVRTLQAISTEKPGPAELSAVSPERATRPGTQGHSFSFEQTRSPIGDQYDDSKIVELRPPLLSTADLAESYRLELDFTSPFYNDLTTSPDELAADNSLPELSQTNGGLLTPGNGRRQGDELFLPENMKGSRPPSQENRLLPSVAQQAPNDGLTETGSGYSSHASLKSLQNDAMERATPAPPSAPERAPPGPPAKETYIAYSAAKILKSMEVDRAPTVVMKPLPAEPEPSATPPEEKPSKADFWKAQHSPKTPKPISKVEDLTRKPADETQASPERAAPRTPQLEQTPKHADATPKARPPITRPHSIFVSPQNTRDSVDTQAEREPIKVVRYTSVKEGPKPSLVENMPKRRPTQKLQKESTHKVLQKATGRPPLAVRARSQSHSAANAAFGHKRSDSSDSLQSLKNMIRSGSRRNSRSNSIVDRTNLEPTAVQKITDIDSDYAIPVAPKMKDRSNRFSIGHAKNLWAESEEQKKEKENEKLEKETEKAKSKQSKATEKEKSKDEKKDKADKKEKASTPPSAEEIEKSIRLKSLPASTPSERALAMLSMGPKSSQKSWRQSLDMKSNASIKSNDSNRETQIRKEFEQEITSFENVAGSLGASPYDVAMKAAAAPGHSNSSNSSDSSLSTIKAREDRPKGPMRDQSGRVVGMDEVSASQFARNRSQIRAMQQERRETLMALHGTPQDIDDQNQQRSFAPQIGNSSFAKQLAAQAGSSIGQKKLRPISIGAAPDAPPLPTINFDELKHKGLTRSKSKKALTTSSAGPPVSALNGVRKRNSGKGRQTMFGRHKELSTQIEVPERFAPLPPNERPTDSSASSISGSEASITTPMSQPESSTSVSSNGSENSASQGKINAPVKQKRIVSSFPSIQVAPTGAGIDGILDAVLAPMTPSPTKTNFTLTSSPNTASFTMSSPQTQPRPNIFGTRPPPPVSPSTAGFNLGGEQKPNVFGTRAPPSVSPSGSTFSSSTTYYTPQLHLSLSSSSPKFPPTGLTGTTTTAPAVSSPLAPPTRPRLQSAMSSRSSVGSSPSTFSVEKKRVAISTAPATILTPSMAPRWQGPSPAELAEMAMMAKSSGKGKEALRSHSAQAVYDKEDKNKGLDKGGHREGRPSSEQGVRAKNEKKRSFGLGGSKLKSNVEA